MTANIRVLPFSIPSANAAYHPRISRIDRMESAGSLLLVDPTNPSGSWSAGVPVNASKVPNLFGDNAAALAGGVSGDHNLTMHVPSAFTGNVGKLERTGKGGLHGIASQTYTTQASGPAMALGTKLIAYMLANPNHSYYISLWDRLTRRATWNVSHMFKIGGSAGSNDFYLNTMSDDATYPQWPGPGRVHSLGNLMTPTPPAVGNVFAAQGTSGFELYKSGQPVTPVPLPGPDSTHPSDTGLYAGGGVMWGSTLPFPGIGKTGATGTGYFNHSPNSSNWNKNNSHAFYRLYIEDLTVSGRTTADLIDLDYAYYTKEVLTPGGRYYGDTFTDPNTIP